MPIRISQPRTSQAATLQDLAANVDRVADSLSAMASAISATVSVSPKWTYVAPAGTPGAQVVFQNGWSNFGANGATFYGPTRFCKDARGIVWVAGLIKGGAAGTVFQLPPGYLPLFPKIWLVDGNGAVAEVRLGDTNIPQGSSASGELRVVSGSNVYLSLDSISYLAER